jgi:hypothetical protein
LNRLGAALAAVLLRGAFAVQAQPATPAPPAAATAPPAAAAKGPSADEKAQDRAVDNYKKNKGKK